MRFKLIALLALVATVSFAKNSVTTVEQVTESVTITGDVDYTITSTTPYGVAGVYVDIQNTEHAVLIFKNIKPSKVIKSYLGFVRIAGAKAVNGTNCQVKMYGTGTIVLPYGDSFKPLTCYTEKSYAGESCNDYTIGHNGGYMKSLTTATLNNRIRSFKLKRGYMVTFAIGLGGWGYSRCYVADDADLEISALPPVLADHISSYRIFKWLDAQKKGLASDGHAEANDILNTSWCYDWGQGNATLLPDHEWVPNHIYEDWPSSATCGSVTGSCNMKNNNEPANSADDHPQSVATVLDNWQNMMRTGMRLCSPATHDGGWSWHNEFMNEIDARGWRCDMVDFHGYWNTGTWNNLSGMINNYAHNRPVWISEWVWGSSWGNAGIFAEAPDGRDSYSTRNQQKNYDGTKPILDRLNAEVRVERYAYWNGEAVCSRIYHAGSLSILGTYYAEMESPIGYDRSQEFVPTVVYRPLSELTGAFDKTKNRMTLSWTDPNGDMAAVIEIQHKAPGTATWKTIQNVSPKDQNAKNGVSYTETVTVEDLGLNAYRVRVKDISGKYYNTNEVSCTIAAAQSVGYVQYGQLNIANEESFITDIEAQQAIPYVMTGILSFKNTSNGASVQVQTMAKGSFKLRLNTWKLPTAMTFTNPETVDYLVLPADTIMHIGKEMTIITQNAGYVKNEVEVIFPEAFPEGVIPVVLAEPVSSSVTADPVTLKVYDITNTGFKAKLLRQEGATGTFGQQKVHYYAATPGQVAIGGGKLLTVGCDKNSPVGGTTRIPVTFTNEEGEAMSFIKPYIIAKPQTHNYPAMTTVRVNNTNKDDQGGIYQMSLRRQIDATKTATERDDAKNYGDYMGWFVISDDPNGTGEETPVIGPTPTAIQTVKANDMAIHVSDRAIYCQNKNARVFNAAGQQVSLAKPLPAGVYVVSANQKSVKVVIR